MYQRARSLKCAREHAHDCGVRHVHVHVEFIVISLHSGSTVPGMYM